MLQRKYDHPGKCIATPISLMVAAAMMLDHVDLTDAARRLRTAIDMTLNTENVRTGDLKGSASTRESADAVCRRLTLQ